MRCAKSIGTALVLATLTLASGTLAMAASQTISIRTNIPGATCVVASTTLGQKAVAAPAKLIVEQSWSIIDVRCSRDCLEGTASIRPALFGGYAAETMVFLKPNQELPDEVAEIGPCSGKLMWRPIDERISLNPALIIDNERLGSRRVSGVGRDARHVDVLPLELAGQCPRTPQAVGAVRGGKPSCCRAQWDVSQLFRVDISNR
jgi:hypothetical protein